MFIQVQRGKQLHQRDTMKTLTITTTIEQKRTLTEQEIRDILEYHRDEAIKWETRLQELLIGSDEKVNIAE